MVHEARRNARSSESLIAAARPAQHHVWRLEGAAISWSCRTERAVAVCARRCVARAGSARITGLAPEEMRTRRGAARRELEQQADRRRRLRRDRRHEAEQVGRAASGEHVDARTRLETESTASGVRSGSPSLAWHRFLSRRRVDIAHPEELGELELRPWDDRQLRSRAAPARARRDERHLRGPGGGGGGGAGGGPARSATRRRSRRAPRGLGVRLVDASATATFHRDLAR